jgi:2-dehydro-3-deoxyphosphogluconate aldolase / (4S)-4-hydroxy-2-oxoglutarate aldolase
VSVATRLAAHRLVPVVVADELDSAEPLADALVAGGLPVAEVTLRTAAALDVVVTLARRGDLLVGAGTVLTPHQVDEAVDAGASFVVSPGFSAPVVERAAQRGVLAIPGVATATELQAAVVTGLSLVKFFPAETSGGVAALAALAAPFAGVSFVPTGGIGPANLAKYLAHPAVAAVGGSWMVERELVRRRDTARLTDLVAQAVELAAAVG